MRSLSSMTSVASRLKTGSSAKAEPEAAGAPTEGASGVMFLLELAPDKLLSKRLIRDCSSVFADSKRDNLASSCEVDWARALSCQPSKMASANRRHDRHSLGRDRMGLVRMSHMRVYIA